MTGREEEIYLDRYARAIKNLGGVSALLRLPDHYKITLMQITDLESKVDLLEFLAKNKEKYIKKQL